MNAKSMRQPPINTMRLKGGSHGHGWGDQT